MIVMFHRFQRQVHGLLEFSCLISLGCVASGRPVPSSRRLSIFLGGIVPCRGFHPFVDPDAVFTLSLVVSLQISLLSLSTARMA
jgi:hypothetical protein